MTERQYRDASTGEFVTGEYAADNPSTTVSESVEGEPTPSVGRVVHYVSYGTPHGEYESKCRAAIITELDQHPEENPDEVFVGLCILNPTGMFFNTTVIQDEDGKTGGSWHWPERT